MADDPITDKLTVRQSNALFALLSEPTISKAATMAEVPERTLRAWLHKPAFEAAYRAARRDAMQQAIGRLQQFSGAAAGTLVALMAAPQPAMVRLGAARAVLEFAIKAVEIEDLRDELERLYALVREMSHESTDL